jgi:hypothetical protein
MKMNAYLKFYLSIHDDSILFYIEHNKIQQYIKKIYFKN